MKLLYLFPIVFLTLAASSDAPTYTPEIREHCKEGCYMIQKQELESLTTAIIKQQIFIEEQKHTINSLSRRMDRSCA